MKLLIHFGLAVVSTVMLTCVLHAGGARAEQQVDARTPAPWLGRQVEEPRLADVRGGDSLSGRVVVPPVSVILWDEPGRLLPPIRNSLGETRQISGQMNTLYK